MSNDRVEQVTAALGAQTTIRGVLETACHGLVEGLDANACAISRVVGDLSSVSSSSRRTTTAASTSVTSTSSPSTRSRRR